MKATTTDIDKKTNYFCALPFIDCSDGELPSGKPIDIISPETISFTKSTSNNIITLALSLATYQGVNSKIIAKEFIGTASNAASLNGRAEGALSVSHASTAGSATTAGSAGYATNAGHATSADSATNAGHASTADTATSADSAGYASSAGSATTAATADNAGHATSADSAGYAGSAGTAAHSTTAGALYIKAASVNKNYALALSDDNNDSDDHAYKNVMHGNTSLVYNPCTNTLSAGTFDGKIKISTGFDSDSAYLLFSASDTISELQVKPRIDEAVYYNHDQEEFHVPSLVTADVSAGMIIVSGSIQAQTFNATSDKRLKTNIKNFPNTISATDVLNKTNIYTFNYLNNLTEKNIGIIAQELEDIDIDGFKIVNQDEKGYLSVKESKLVYLLIQGFKEQNKKIQDLENQIQLLLKGNS
jgi:hypothetical protein